MHDYERILSVLCPVLLEAGFDLVAPLQLGWYNQRVDAAFRLTDFGSPRHLGLVIGNTRALWEKFLAALAADPELARAEQPLDSYTEQCLTRALAALELPANVRFAHSIGHERVAMQALAHAAGLAYLSESHLSVHALYGPWIGLRAGVSFGVPGPEGPAPVLAHPCAGCAERCLPAFRRAEQALAGQLDAATARTHADLLLACRDACPTGREHRYGEAQIRYHYSGDRSLLAHNLLTQLV
jgi:methylmalonic aciduria homocystinuria type C protein